MSAKKGPTISEQVIQILMEHGPKKVADMMPYINIGTAKSVHSKCLEMAKMNLMSHDADMVWTLKPGVTPMTLVTGKLQDGTKKEEGDMTTETGKDNPLTPPPPPQPLNMEGQFSELLLGSGVDKVYVPTITKLFFSGDINSLKWLKEVLTRHAAGYVKPHQLSLISSTWSKSRGLPYNPDEFDIEGEGQTKGGKTGGAAKLMEDAGIGWKVVKDKDGDWVPMPGGTLSQEEATAAAERRATIAAMGLGGAAATAEEPTEGAEGKPAPKAGKAPRAFQDIFMEKMVDHFFDEKKGRGDEDSPQLKALSQQLERATATINQMREDREQERFDRIEANIAAIASRDPWEDPRSIEIARQRLGIPNTTVTDNSPAVQLMKDSADKIDKNVGRLVGIIERTALQSDLLRPEQTRTPAEKESKADALLAEANKRARSTELRQRAFGM